MHDILHQIRGSLGELSPTEHAIGSYLLDAPHDVLRLPIAEVALRIGTSQAAIVRFCKRYGLHGFKELKQEMTTCLLQPAEDETMLEKAYPAWDSAESTQELITKVTQNHISSIIDSRTLLSAGEMERAIDAVSGAARIDFYGVGASGLIAQDAQLKFSRIGVICNSYSDSHFQICSAATLSKNDVAVLISNSGTTRDLLEIAAAAKESGATLIVVTSAPKSRLAAFANILLQTCSPEISTYNSAMGTRIAQFTLLDILFCGCFTKRPDIAKEYLAKSFRFTRVKKL